MSKQPPLRCPRCGEQMNHHADKLVAPTSDSEAALVDSTLGGVVQEAHGCPGCGYVVLQSAGDHS